MTILNRVATVCYLSRSDFKNRDVRVLNWGQTLSLWAGFGCEEEI
jgi:hypothetical protein